MIYIDDAINAIIKLMKTSKDNLRIKSSYNISGFSMSPKMIADELKNLNKEFDVEYKSDFRQAIADSWPNSIMDNYAREDWGWKENFDFKKTVKEMIHKLNIK
jgi:nucleoside-diphosphate-sugar epimerase